METPYCKGVSPLPAREGSRVCVSLVPEPDLDPPCPQSSLSVGRTGEPHWESGPVLGAFRPRQASRLGAYTKQVLSLKGVFGGFVRCVLCLKISKQ